MERVPACSCVIVCRPGLVVLNFTYWSSFCPSIDCQSDGLIAINGRHVTLLNPQAQEATAAQCVHSEVRSDNGALGSGTSRPTER